MAVDAGEFKQALACWAAGVTVVTTRDADGAPAGMTVSAFSSVSAEPPRILVCINQSASCCPLIEAAGLFGVNILRTGQDALSNKFASYKDKETRWDGVAVETRVTGAPLLTDALARLDCRVVDRLASGTHIIYIGEVVHASVSDATPLLYYKGAYRGIEGL